jgi:hypothetical protein
LPADFHRATKRSDEPKLGRATRGGGLVLFHPQAPPGPVSAPGPQPVTGARSSRVRRAGRDHLPGGALPGHTAAH